MIGLNEAGDTIVEVLIVIAVISLVLAAAFVTSNRSLHSVQDAQEHAEAQTLVTGQIEELKSLSSATGSPTLFTVSSPFCITKNGGALTLAPYGAVPPASCVMTGSGATAVAGTQPAYTLRISRVYSAVTRAYSFTVRATWGSVFGNTSTNNVTMYYRLYQ